MYYVFTNGNSSFFYMYFALFCYNIVLSTGRNVIKMWFSHKSIKVFFLYRLRHTYRYVFYLWCTYNKFR